MNLINLPDVTKFIIILYLDSVSLLKLKGTSKFFYYFIQNNIHLIHSVHKSRNKYIPKILWTPCFYKNFKKFLISFEKSKRKKFIKDYSSKNKFEKLLFLKNSGICDNLVYEIIDDEQVVDRYNYLLNNGVSSYQSYRLSISNFDDEDLFNYTYLIKNKITHYTSEKIVENSDTIDIRKFLFCVKKGIPFYTSECLAKKFSYTQLDRFFLLRDLGTSIYCSEKIIENFNNVEILKYMYLVEKKIPPFWSELIVMILRKEDTCRCNPDLYYFYKNLTPFQMLEFRNIK